MALTWKKYSSIEEMQADDYKEPAKSEAAAEAAHKGWREEIAITRKHLYPNGLPNEQNDRDHEPS